jgi:GDPmannose 4,6-dehydratase
MKKALITGASGQDSILLSEHLLGLGYSVWALERRTARPSSRYVTKLLETYPNRYHLINGDITDMSSIIEAIKISKPDEFYNLAAQSHVGLSFKEPISTSQITGLGVLNCLEAIRKTKSDIRFYQASSSEMFGGTKSSVDPNQFLSSEEIGNISFENTLLVINEDTPLEPRSPYACAKVFGHNITKNYREAYSIHASCGILFNHESELRKLTFVTRKVTTYVAKLIVQGNEWNQPKLKLGTLDFARDWGCAKDYVRGMHLMLQQDKPDDYILATGKVFTGKNLLDAAFAATPHLDWKDFLEIDEEFKRPSDVKVLIGDARKANFILDWKPTRTFERLISDMVLNDVSILKQFGDINE